MEKRVTEIKNLKPGSYVLIDDVPCKVDSIQLSKSGKHGSAKARITASGVFETKKVSVVKPGDSKMDVPIIEKKSMQVISIIGSNAQLMDLDDYSNIEVDIPEELRDKLVEGGEVLVWKFGKNILIKGNKA